jgi:transcription-repair coupling factor (superfamily II helicase)
VAHRSSLFSSLIVVPEAGQAIGWGRLIGASAALAALELAEKSDRPILVLASDPRHADQLEAEIRFFAEDELPVLHFVEWETLPYDSFSPHQDIIAQQLQILSVLPTQKNGIIIASAPTLLQRLPPIDYIATRSFSLNLGQILKRQVFIDQLITSGYLRVPQVNEHGEFAVRGSLLDIFPIGSYAPLRIDFFDDEIESLRLFDADSQLSGQQIEQIRILPAREIPLDQASIRNFRDRYRERFEGQPSRSRVYQEVSDGIAHGGIEYYLPLFFASTTSLLDYLPANCILYVPSDIFQILEIAWQDIHERYQLYSLDPERPILLPEESFEQPQEIREHFNAYSRIEYSSQSLRESSSTFNLPTKLPPAIRIEARYEDPARAIIDFLEKFDGRILFTADSPGRLEIIYEMLIARNLDISRIEGWQEFLNADQDIGVTVSPIQNSVLLPEAAIAIITEQQLFGGKSQQRSRKRLSKRDPETIIRQLNDLQEGTPVVHLEYGVGRYLGLMTLEASGITGEFLNLEYADGDKLYVPVHSLNLISRYTGASAEKAPLHKLGSNQWSKARLRAIKKIRDTAAELLDVYARRAARPGHRFHWAEADYQAFVDGFSFEPTEDQAHTIEEVLKDMASDKPMDRIVCGDVGFGKTEVALRASFAAVQDGKQVAILVPTTLLAQQHDQTFKNRFANWPILIEVLSRFRSRKEIMKVIEEMRNGTVDIVIGTHRLLHYTKEFRDIGLVIIDEEHRFGVRHKEAIKAMRSEVDVLTLTATPIPRTLNMTLGGLRDMSLITTPPSERLAVNTFVTEWNDVVIREACLREIKRGGQVFFIHNRVKDIASIEERLTKLIPEASIRIGHGQIPERELEQVMLDYYHRRFNVLLCTTIIESGIDVPTANTIIINRADRFGLSQLHQLRGRVGRSHHRAYAYLVVPPKAVMTTDAIKRLEAINSLDALGSGFVLATHDLEIRGAGELLGETQSGQIQEIGFSLYTELLARTVKSLRAGEKPDLEESLHTNIDINFYIPALLPENYVADVHLRLILYKRIASASSQEQLQELQVELIDRFGLLPEPAKNLIQIAAIKQDALMLGIEKINASESGGYIQFGDQSQIDPSPLVQLIHQDNQIYRMQGTHRLQFRVNLSNVEQKFKFIKKLLTLLVEKPGSDTLRTLIN